MPAETETGVKLKLTGSISEPAIEFHVAVVVVLLECEVFMQPQDEDKHTGVAAERLFNTCILHKENHKSVFLQ
jgi:hypothetical protein